MNPQTYFPFILPLIVIAVLYFRTRNRSGKPRPVRSAQLWITPVTAILGIGTGLWFLPQPAWTPLSIAVVCVAVFIGIGTGVLRARSLRLSRHETTGEIVMETSSFAFLVLAALILLRTVARSWSGHGALAIDASMLFALGMIVTQRLTMLRRVRAVA